MKLSSLISWTLAAGCALLLLVALLLGSGALTDIDANGAGTEVPERPLPDAAGRGEFELPPLEEYAEIAQRPLFNEDRRPAPPDEAVVDTDEPPEQQVPTSPLDVSVKGIIITPEVRLAIVTDNRTKETLRLREGMPLEGDMANWTLTDIEPRKLTFDGDSMGDAEVELQVHTQALAGGPPAQVRQPVRPGDDSGEAQGEETAQAGEEKQEADSPMDAEARAEEIRRRVAERRAQLREEAERRRQQQAEEQ